MDLNRFIPLFIPLSVWLLSELYFFRPGFIFVSSVLINLLLFFAIWRFSAAGRADKRWWNYLILPLAASTAIIVYSVLLSAKSVIQLLFILNFFFLYFYLRRLYYFFLRGAASQLTGWENVYAYVGWLSFFLLAAAVYGLQSFLNLSVFKLIMIILLAAALLLYQLFWANQIAWRAGLPYVLLGCLVLAELAWSISFLPFNYNISGFSLAVCFYAVSGLAKNRLLDKLDAKKVKMYLLLSTFSLLTVILTARWV